MKDQVKSRMEVLLQMELEERALARSISRQTASVATSTTATTTGKTSSTSSVAGRASVSSTTASVSGGKGSSREEVKADMLFNTDRGKHERKCVCVCVCVCTCMCTCIHVCVTDNKTFVTLGNDRPVYMIIIVYI